MYRVPAMNDIHDNFAEATRIAAGDDGTNYDNVAIALHWATALLVVVQFAMAKLWDSFDKPTRQGMESIHVSLGVLLTVVVLVRIAWRLIPGHQRPAIVSGWVKLASKGVHYLLYALLVAQAGIGIAWRWAQGHEVSFFGLFAITGPYGRLDRPTRHIFHDLHENVAWAIVVIAGLHAAAALYHHYALRDRVLARMLPLARG
jgi:cytochrome b561